MIDGFFKRRMSDMRDTIANCGDIRKLADRLMAEDFIDFDKEQDIMDQLRQLSKRDRSECLIQAVRSQAKLDPSKFKVFVEILKEQPSLKSLAVSLQEDYGQQRHHLQHAPFCVSTDRICFHHYAENYLPGPTLTRQASTSSSDSESPPSELLETSLERKWALLITDLVDILEGFEKALERMKTALENLVLPRPAKTSAKRPRRSKRLEECVLVVTSSEYKEVKTVRELFRLLAPLQVWSCIEPSLLGFVIEASRCQPAKERFQDFLKLRKSTASSTAIPLNVNLAVSDERTSPQMETAVPNGAPAQESTSHQLGENNGVQRQPTAGQVEIKEKLDRDALTVEEYDKNADYLCGIMAIPRYFLAYFGARDGCIVLRWGVPRQLLPHMLGAHITDNVLRTLAGLRVKEVRIGAHFHLAVPTPAYWEVKQDVEV